MGVGESVLEFVVNLGGNSAGEGVQKIFRSYR
jgi:hypothetical protein